jgi:hypothetical protein
MVDPSCIRSLNSVETNVGCIRPKIFRKKFGVVQFQLSTKMDTKIKCVHDHHDLCVKR